MGKRGFTLAAAVAALSGWGLQAQAAGPAISGVALVWTGQQIRVTWTEGAPMANTVTLSTGKVLGTTTVADANELLVDRAAVGVTDNQFDRQTVSVSDSSGGSATSPVFDRYIPHPKMQFYLASGDNAKWFLEPPSYLDPTPNDPLDVDAPETYAVKLHEQAPAGACQTVLVSDSTAQTGLIPRRANPYQLNYDTTNEWGTRPGDDVGNSVGYAETTQPAMTVPPNAPYGTSTVIRGSVGNTLVGKSYENCMTFAGSNFTATVTLQAEDVAGGTWADLQSFTLSSAYRAFQFTVPSNGARTYRVAVNSSESNPTVYYGSTSQTAQLRSVTRVMSAKFIKPVISLGTQPQAYLWVNPAGQQRAALQWKNPSGIWQGITYKYLYDGKGLVAFAFNRRGTFQFRWYVPGTSTVDGLPVDATYTGPFSLTVN